MSNADPKVTDFDVSTAPGSLTDAKAVFEGTAVQLLARDLVQWFRENGAQNYVTLNLSDPDTGDGYELTMQRTDHETPGDQVESLLDGLEVVVASRDDEAQTIQTLREDVARYQNSHTVLMMERQSALNRAEIYRLAIEQALGASDRDTSLEILRKALQ